MLTWQKPSIGSASGVREVSRSTFRIADFLSDPGGKYGFNSNLVTFDRLAEFPCAVLLGEPGIGKSWTLVHESAEVQKSLTPMCIAIDHTVASEESS